MTTQPRVFRLEKPITSAVPRNVFAVYLEAKGQKFWLQSGDTKEQLLNTRSMYQRWARQMSVPEPLLKEKTARLVIYENGIPVLSSPATGTRLHWKQPVVEKC